MVYYVFAVFAFRDYAFMVGTFLVDRAFSINAAFPVFADVLIRILAVRAVEPITFHVLAVEVVLAIQAL